MYTPEQVERLAFRTDWMRDSELKRGEAAAMLRAYAATLKAAQGGVTDDVVDRVAKAIADAAGHGMREKCEQQARAAIAALSAQQGEAVAWLHTVTQGDGETDHALSFSPDSFPLDTQLGFRSLGCRPLGYIDTHPAAPVGVPDGWSGWCTQYPNRLPKLWGAREIAELNYQPEEGQRMFQVVEVAAAPSAPQGQGEALLARVCGMVPGMSRVTLQLPSGPLPEWADLGCTVSVGEPTAPPAQPAERVPEDDVRDAARYRFIRDVQATIIYKGKGHGVWEPLIDTRETSTRCASLDEAVDRAMLAASPAPSPAERVPELKVVRPDALEIDRWRAIGWNECRNAMLDASIWFVITGTNRADTPILLFTSRALAEQFCQQNPHPDGYSIYAASPAPSPARGDGDFQSRVSTWMDQCFLPSLYSNMTERGDRLLEEVLELLQSTGYDRSRVATLVDYVWSRPVGEPSQEVGGVMVTLAGFCWIAGLNMHADGETELARINRPEVMEKIRRKQQAKNALHFDTPLPGHATTQDTRP